MVTYKSMGAEKFLRLILIANCGLAELDLSNLISADLTLDFNDFFERFGLV